MPKDPDAEPSQPDTESEEADGEDAPGGEATQQSADDKPARRRVSAPPRKRRRPKKRLPRTEAEIDSPKPLTLWLLGVMCSATLVMWGSARLACNYSGDAPKAAPQLPTAALARTPKDAAIELAQRWATQNFSGALELAKGPLADEIRQEKQKACGGNEAACKEKSAELASRVLSRGVLLSQDTTSALVRVTSTLPAGSKTLLLRLEPDGAIWKGVERTADTAANKR